MSTHLRVLLLEDQPDDAELVVHELRRSGFELDWQRVETKSDYLAQLDTAPDVVLADFALPQFDAMRALRLMQDRGLDTPFIVITGSIGEEAAVECIKQGAADYLLKDRLTRLGQSVTAALEQQRLREDKRKADEDQRRRTQELEALFHMAKILVEPGDLPEKLERALRELVRVSEVDNAVLREYNASAQALELVASVGTVRAVVEPLPSNRPGPSLTTTAFQSAQPVIVNAYPVHPHTMPTAVNNLGIQSVAAMPIIADSKVLGVVTVTSRQANHFTPSRVNLLTAMTDGLGALLKNAELQHAERLRNRELEALTAIGAILIGPGEFSEKVDGLLHEVNKIAEADLVCIRQLDEGAGYLRILGKAGPMVDELPPSEAFDALPIGESVGGVAASNTGTPIIVDDYQQHPRAMSILCDLQVQSAFYLPFRSGERNLGVMSFHSRAPAFFSPERAGLLTSIGKGISTMLENARLQDVVRESEENYRAVVDNANDAIVINQHGKRVFVNKAFLTIHGLENMSQAIGQPITQYVVPEDKKMVEERTRRRELGEKVSEVSEYRIRRGDGEVRTLQTSAVTITHEGQPAALAVMRDVTEQRRLQAQLIQADKLAAVGTLVSGVAHEINNPLTGALGLLQLLLRGELAEDMRSDLQMVHDETNRAVRIMRNLLSFVREHKAERARISINEVLETTLELRAYEMHVQNVTVEKDLQPDLPETMADPHQLRQVLLNLIINAEQAMIEAHGQGTLFVKTLRQGDAIRILVADDGPGIPPENLSKVYDPFFTTKPVGKGTGLGLSIAYGIVQGHGGTLSVTNRPEGGAAFTIDLPIAADTASGT